MKNACEHLDISINEAIKMATCRVASAINMDNEIGKIKKGFPAHFVTFNNDFSTVESLVY